MSFFTPVAELLKAASLLDYLFMISSNGFNDITSEFSDNRIIGSTNSIGDFVLFYNAEAEEPIPNKISLFSIGKSTYH